MNTRRTSSHIVRTLLALTLRDALKASLCAAPLFAALPAAAQTSTASTAPVTIVMTFPAGSGVDIVGRLMQDSMQKSLGTNIVDVSNVLTINLTVVDVKSARELVDLVRANPGKYNYASTGNGTGTHLAMAEFVARAGLNITHVPYKGTAPALTDLLGGQVEMMFDNLGVSAQHVRSGKLKALAVGSVKRAA